MIASLARQDSKSLANFESKLTLPMAMNHGTLLRNLERTQDRELLLKCLSYIIIRSMDFFNVGQKINDDQSVMLAMDLMEVFGYENLEDVVLMFKYARQGKLGGKIFRIDGHVVINEWVPAYLELKAIEREKQWNHTKSEMNNVLKSEWNDDSLKKLNALGIGSNAQVNNKAIEAPGLGKDLKKWLGKGPLTEAWGNRKNPVDTQKHLENIKNANS